MADNKIANAIKFLKGEEKSLPAAKTEGQVYFAYKNVGTAEKPSYTGAIYIDTPIGGTQNRIKMTANADIADKAFNDSAGLNIRDTYLSSLGYTDDGKQIILIKGSGNNQTRIALPVASTTKSGIVTTDAQSFNGTKTFTTINSTNLTVTGSNGFNYSSIGAGTANIARPVWFADNSGNGKPVVNTNFTYNPATQTLKVANLSGTADKAIKDSAGNDIRNTYISNITVNNDIMTITKGSGATSTLSIKDKLYSGAMMATKEDLDKFIEANVFKFGHINAIEGYNGLEKNNGIILSASWTNSTNYGHQIFIDDSGYALRHRYRNSGNWSDWASILDSTNYNSYAPTKTGDGASGTWGISITGSANKLTTARTLWGQSFDGSGNVSGQISGCTRVMNANSNSLYLGNYDNTGWVYTQDICSQAGQDNWTIRQNGLGIFKNISIGYNYSDKDTFYALKVKGNTLYNGKVYFANDTTYYINESADANLRAVGTSDKTYIAFPQGGGYRANTSSVTGYLKITLPVTWTNTMMSFKVTIYEYRDNLSCTYYLSGYNDIGNGGTWTRVSAYSLSKSNSRTISDRIVRFGHDGSKCAIYIGENNSSWSYPQIQISDITVGHNNSNYTKWASGWSVEFTTTLGNITATVTKPCVSNSAATLETNAGSATKPVYFSGGVPVQCNDTLANNISGTSASTDAINWVAGNEVRFTRPNFTSPQTLHFGWAWADGSKVKLISEYKFDGGDGQPTQVTASQFNGNLNGNANTATALTSSAGSSTQPIYFSGGKPVVCTYTLSKSVPADAKFTDTWRPLGTTGDTACAGNDSRLSNARPASDVYGWAKASSKPSYSWGEINGKPSTFTPSSHTHYSLSTIGDKRATATTPNSYSNTFVFQGLKNNDTIGITSTDTYSYVLGLRGWADVYGGDSHELAFNSVLGILTRSGSTTWNAWRRILDSANYIDYTVTKDGLGASGTWGINISGSSESCTGNADTATKLQTPRTINGIMFDGSSNITTTKWGTGRYISIKDCDSSNTGTAALVDGSGNTSLYMPSSARFTGTVGIGHNPGATLKFYSDATTISAKIVAYNDRIEFVFG